MRAAILLSLFCVPVFAQDTGKGKGELTDAVEILKKADEATKAVKTIKYEATAKGLGASESRAGVVEGTVVLVGWTGGGPEKWFYDVKMSQPGSTDTRQAQAGSDGDTFFLVDVREKKAYEDIDPAVLGTLGGVMRRGITMAEFVHPTPFSDEINGEKHELKGVTDVAGEKCYEIVVKYAGTPQEAHWFFSTTDLLPRRVDRWFEPRAERGGAQLIITKLWVDPKLEERQFKLVLPEGFEKIDDFAP